MAIYPFYLGKEIAKPLLKLLMEAEQPVAILPGRFQPFHRGHYEAYKYLVDKFGADNVYIATSDKTEPGRSPFNFADKQSIISSMFGIDPSHIVQTRLPYNPVEITSQLPHGTPVVLGIGEKDAGRVASLPTLPDDASQMAGFDTPTVKGGATIYATTVPMVAGDADVSGEQARTVFSSGDDAAKQALFQKMYGQDNPEMLGMISGRVAQSAQQAATIGAEKQRKAAAPRATQFYGDYIQNPDTNNDLSVKSALAYPRDSHAYLAARAYLKSKGVLIESASSSKIDNIRDFVKFAVEALGLKKLPKIFLNSNENFVKQALSLGVAYSSPSKIVVGVHNRLTADILRTLAHELAHKKQEEMGTLPKNTSRENSTGSPSENQANAIAGILLRKYSEINPDVLVEQILLEGGAFGHMLHPYEDMDLTFADLKELVQRSLITGLEQEGPISEKVDGQNLMVTFRDGQVRFARRETQMRNAGEATSTADEVRAEFIQKGIGKLATTFGEAAADLDRAISGLSIVEQNAMFGNGTKYMNVEILHPNSENIIPYGQNMLVLHQTIEVDSAGRVIGMDSEGGELLANKLKANNAETQREYNIRGRQPLKIFSDAEGNKAGEKAAEYTAEIDSIQKQYGLTDAQTLGDYKKRAWGELLDDSGVELSPEEREGLMRRWASGDKSYLIRKLPQSKQEWAKEVDARANRINGNFMSPVQLFVGRLAADTILRSNELLASQNPEAAEKITKKLNDAIHTIRASDDLDAQEKIDHFLHIVDGIGLEKLAPTEGIVFSYKGKLFKYTGLFAPINRIINTLRMARPDSKLGQYAAQQRQVQQPQQSAASPTVQSPQIPQSSPAVSSAQPSVPAAPPQGEDDTTYAGVDPSLLDKTIDNPETGNQILVRSALKYQPEHPVYKAARSMIDNSR